MKVTRVAVAAICLLFFSMSAISQNQSKPKSHKLFEVTKAFLIQIKPICNTEACQELIQQVSSLIAETEQKHNSGALLDDDRKAFHQGLGERILKIQIELQKILISQNQAQLKDPGSLKPFLTPVQDMDLCAACDRTFNQATAICSLYIAAGPSGIIAAAICEAVAIYAYNDCLQRNGCMGGGGSPAPIQSFKRGDDEEIYGMDAA